MSFYGEEIDEKALRNLVLVNHQFYCDWLIGFVLGYRTNKHGYLKIVMKKSIEYIPGVGKHFDKFERFCVPDRIIAETAANSVNSFTLEYIINIIL